MNRIISKRAGKLKGFRRVSSKLIIRREEEEEARNEEEEHHLILWRYQILAPDSDIVAHWNHIFLVTCIVSLFIDPLYFFLPSVGGPACISSDDALSVTITFFRTITDLFFALHLLMKFRTAFVAPSSRVFGRGELVMDPKEIAMRYLKKDFVIDLAAALPIPQACFPPFSFSFSFSFFFLFHLVWWASVIWGPAHSVEGGVKVYNRISDHLSQVRTFGNSGSGLWSNIVHMA